MADRARQKTDKMLRDLERRVRAVYESDPSLRRIQAKYNKYMESVASQTKEAYWDFQNETDTNTKQTLKKKYIEDVKKLTIQNRVYKDMISEFTRIMASVNQSALDLVNAEMEEIYALNYNQLAVDCRKIGIKVNG